MQHTKYMMSETEWHSVTLGDAMEEAISAAQAYVVLLTQMGEIERKMRFCLGRMSKVRWQT